MYIWKTLAIQYLYDEWVKYKWQFVFQLCRIFSSFNFYLSRSNTKRCKKKTNLWICLGFLRFIQTKMWPLPSLDEFVLHLWWIYLLSLGWKEKKKSTTTTMNLFAVNKQTLVSLSWQRTDISLECSICLTLILLELYLTLCFPASWRVCLFAKC